MLGSCQFLFRSSRVTGLCHIMFTIYRLSACFLYFQAHTNQETVKNYLQLNKRCVLFSVLFVRDKKTELYKRCALNSSSCQLLHVVSAHYICFILRITRLNQFRHCFMLPEYQRPYELFVQLYVLG